MRDCRPPKKRKRWTFLSAAEYLTQMCNQVPHVHANPAGAARLLAWAVRRVGATHPWRADQEHPLTGVGTAAMVIAEERSEAHGGPLREPWRERMRYAYEELEEAASERGFRPP